MTQDGRPQMGRTPLVSIVTPSYNMGRYLEEAVRSVLSQDYPEIEYIVMDAGSTDGSIDILRRYEGRLRYISEPDHGQCDAINRGFLESRGEIFGFLCADDTLLPGAISTAVPHMLANRQYSGVYGDAYLTDENGAVISGYPTRDFDPELLRTECFICQPASFLWREAFAAAGMLDTRLHYSLDYEFWMRFAKRHKLLRIPGVLATSRVHRGSKSLTGRSKVYRANIRLLKRYYGYAPFPAVYGYCCSLLDSRDGILERVPPSAPKYLLSLVYGSYENAGQLPRYWKDWAHAGVDAFRRKAWRAPEQRA
jgi:glycosyltransferase involved in cell wall biosynthesis